MLTAGVDEAGRGPLAGPVMAAAVVLDPATDIVGITDSKKLSAAARERLSEQIKSAALDWAVGRAEIDEIDTLNILHATMLAMQRAVSMLKSLPELVLVDGNRTPSLPIPARAVVRGDLLVPCISAASILAKVSRDQEMQELDRLYPHYGFARHKGYPTRQHLQALSTHGLCAVHRRSFAPVKQYL